jgi:hypothetical protein
MTRGELIRQLRRRRVDVREVGDELKMNCPVCGDRRGRLFFNTVLQKGFCQNECGGFSRRRFHEAFGLVDLDAASRTDVAEMLERELEPTNDAVTRQGPAGSPFPVSSAVMAWRHPASWHYLQTRPTPVTKEQAMRHFLTYVPFCRRHRNSFDLTCVSCYCQKRLVIPITQVGFIARDVTKQSPLKDKALPTSMIRTLLYGIGRLKGTWAMLVAGVLDYCALKRSCRCRRPRRCVSSCVGRQTAGRHIGYGVRGLWGRGPAPVCTLVRRFESADGRQHSAVRGDAHPAAARRSHLLACRP